MPPRAYLRLMGHAQGGVGGSSAGQPGQAKLRQWSGLTRGLLFIFGGAGIVVLWILLSRQCSDRSVAAIQDADRRLLYERTLENLRFCKANGQATLPEFCRQQAELILTLPECDDSCIELSRQFVPRPTR